MLVHAGQHLHVRPLIGPDPVGQVPGCQEEEDNVQDDEGHDEDVEVEDHAKLVGEEAALDADAGEELGVHVQVGRHLENIKSYTVFKQKNSMIQNQFLIFFSFYENW